VFSIILEADSCEFGSGKYFALCGLGGILSCGITHTMIVPLDLVKCRLQVNPAKYKSVVNGFRVCRLATKYFEEFGLIRVKFRSHWLRMVSVDWERAGPQPSSATLLRYNPSEINLSIGIF
jgi:hypothetical protein